MISKMLSNIRWNLFAELVQRGGLFLAFAYLAKIFDVNEFAYFVIAIAFINQLWTIVDMGTNMYGIRKIAQEHENKNKIYSLVISIRILLLLLLMISLFIIPIDSFFEKETRTLIYYGLIYIFFKSFYLDWMLKGDQKYLSLFLSSLMYIAIYFLFLFFFVDSPKGAMLLWGLAFLPSIIFLGIRYQYNVNVRFSITANNIFNTLKESYKFCISTSALLFAIQLPLFYLSKFGNNEQVANFSIALRILLIFMSFSFVVILTFYPNMGKMALQNPIKLRGYARKIAYSATAIGVIMYGLVHLYSDLIVKLLFPEEYISSAKILQSLSIIIPIYYLRSSIGVYLHSIGRTITHSICSVSGLVVSLIVGFYLIKFHTLEGAIYSLLSVEVTILILMLITSKLFIKL